MVFYIDLCGTMSLLWYSIWYLCPDQREAKSVRGESLNHCSDKLYIQSTRRVFGMRFRD